MRTFAAYFCTFQLRPLQRDKSSCVPGTTSPRSTLFPASSLFLSFFFAPTFALPWFSFLPSQVCWNMLECNICYLITSTLTFGRRHYKIHKILRVYYKYRESRNLCLSLSFCWSSGQSSCCSPAWCSCQPSFSRRRADHG